MMEISDELRARIYATYYGAKYTTYGEEPEVFAIIGETLTCCERYPKSMQQDKLILKRPASLPDEELREVAKLAGLVNGKVLVNKMTDSVFVSDNYYRLQIWFDGSLFGQRGCIPVCLDHLRSKGYDFGYGHIPSLIDAGLAVEEAK